jgi:hypothetical protein
MSYQVVNPATGEIAAQFPDDEGNLKLAKELCDRLRKGDNNRWDVLRIEVVYSTKKEL